MLKTLLFVFVGGGFGSCLRFLISKWLNSASSFMPYGTLCANVLACIVLGMGAFYFSSKTQTQENNYFSTLILIGFCGGFSTFSTFSNELFGFMKAGQTFNMAVYAITSLVLCNLAIGLGLWLGKALLN
ncbi:MAG: CrcB protein [Arenicella sp.]|jgi:CrcB protein